MSEQNNRLGAHYNRYDPPAFVPASSVRFNGNDYTTAFSNDPDKVGFSVSQEPNIEYETITHYLVVSSRDRDTTAYPSPSQYTIHLQNDFKNITSMELIQATIPDKNSVTAEPYLLLKIDELEEVMHSNDRNMSDAFAILQMAPPVTTGGFIHIDKRIHENVVAYFGTPKSSLSKLSINITDLAGTSFNFGNDSPAPLKALQNTFVFKIETLEKKRNVLNHRNVF
jgi:hypothetical protein